MKTVIPPPHNPHKTLRTTIFATATIVTILSVAERSLGFLYRIVLSRLLGAEGLGLYQVALSIFSVFLTIGTGGLPITVSRLISKSKAENSPLNESGAVSAGFTLTLLLTLPVVLLLGIFPKTVSFLFSDERGLNVFRILLLGLCFSSVYAVVRGFFWGNKKFLLPSLLEISEETVMVIVGILLLKNVSSAAVGAEKAAWAVVISYLFSCSASLLCFFFSGGKLSSPKKQLKPLFNATLPITSVRASSSFVNSAVAVLLPVMLIRAGASESDALKLFGIVSGMVIPILFIPSTVIGSLSLVLVPELSEDFYRKKTDRLRKNIERGLKFSFLIACVLIPFFYALGEDVGTIAFSNKTAGEMIKKSAPLLLPMSLTMISTGILNSMGFEKKTFLFYFIGAAVLLLSILFLPAFCGVYAYVIGLGLSFLLNAVCNLVLLHKKCPIYKKGDRRVLVQTVLPALFCILPLSLFGQLCNTLFKRFLGELFAFLLTVLFLLFATFSLYAVTRLFSIKGIFKNFHRKKENKGVSV